MAIDLTTVTGLSKNEFFPIIVQVDSSLFNIGVTMDETSCDILS